MLSSAKKSIRHKVLICLFLLGSVLSTAVGAGPTSAQDVELGLYAGGTFASLRGETSAVNNIEQQVPESSVELGRRGAFQVGGFAQIELNEWLAVRPEISYVQKGAVLDATLRAKNPRTGDVQTVAEVDGTVRFNYLELPVLAKLQIPPKGRLEPSLFAGPSFGFNLLAESETELRSNVEVLENKTVTEEVDTREMEIGAVLGGELAYVLSSGHAVSLDVRYGTGLTDVSPEDAEASAQNETIRVGIGYSFSF